MDYDETPSFYRTEEMFENYLGRTSYYTALQDAVTDIVGYAAPDALLELGTGTGHTASRIANAHPDCSVTAIDRSEQVIETAETTHNQPNLTFTIEDMEPHVASTDTLPPMVVMLYSFHHIPDPRARKTDFLDKCYAALPDDGYLCIAEGFIDDRQHPTLAESTIRRLWARRGVEAYASTFWNTLDGLDADAIDHAQDVGTFSKTHELEAGDNVATRDEEYLVSMQWLVDHAEQIGFDTVLAEPVNALGDGVVLLQKP